MSDLPTAPIGKQQLIDMRAGSILRGHKRRYVKYLGCSARFLVTFIILAKSVLLFAWLLREYYYFDYHCVLMTSAQFNMDEEEYSDYSMENLVDTLTYKNMSSFPRDSRKLTIRSLMKRSILDPRLKSSKNKKRPPHGEYLTTMVTLTNTQILPVEGNGDENSLKMKTIRNRVETVMESDDVIGIEIQRSNPKIHISKIISRRVEGEEVPLKKAKKRKGNRKGNKKKKQELEELATIESVTKHHKKERKKGLGRKKNKNKENGKGEITKAPRHLFTGPTDWQSSTQRPHQSVFIHGAIDPDDLKFSNQGQIRGYPMHTASRRPKANIRISEETRLMWQLDEVNYTTLAIAPKTTAITKEEDSNSKHDENNFAAFKISQPSSSSNIEPLTTLRSVDTVTSWNHVLSTVASVSSGLPSKTNGGQKREQLFEENSEKIKSTIDKFDARNTDAQILEGTTVVTATIKSRQAKQGLYGRLDTSMVSSPMKNIPTSQKNDEDADLNFQSQLSTFTSSAICIGRTLFDIWCACQVITAFPYLVGVCVARRSLFVSHLVLDILLLVIGFVYSITMVVFSVVLYILVGEMQKSTLFEWLLFALLLDALLLIYTAIVVISLRCCERIVQSQHVGKDSATYPVVVTSGDHV